MFTAFIDRLAGEQGGDPVWGRALWAAHCEGVDGVPGLGLAERIEVAYVCHSGVDGS